MDKETSLELLTLFFNNTPDNVYVKDASSAFLLASKATVKLLKAEKFEDIEGKTDYDFFPKELADIYFKDEQEIMRTGIPIFDKEEPVYTDSVSEARWLSTSKIPLRDQNGKIIGILGSGRDISYRKHIQETLRNKDIELAHQSGKAEVAADVLHNVGNVLNSVYVSSIEMVEILSKSSLLGLIKANDLLQSNRSNIVDFILNNPKGQALLDYYIKIGEELIAEKNRIENELSQQLNKINIIKEILDIQQSFTKSPSFFENLSVSGVINDSLLILQRAVLKNQITLVNNSAQDLTVFTNKARLTHVIINIVKNAIEAMEGSARFNRVITIESKKDITSTYIIFSDKGEGIAKENLALIFNHGFTTKKEGRGFGLHACANSMTELKGKIFASSEGVGKGSVFTLVFPNHDNYIRTL
jgi:PAS domain S-box-containing protein